MRFMDHSLLGGLPCLQWPPSPAGGMHANPGHRRYDDRPGAVRATTGSEICFLLLLRFATRDHIPAAIGYLLPSRWRERGCQEPSLDIAHRCCWMVGNPVGTDLFHPIPGG